MTSTFTLTGGETITRAYRILGNLGPPWVPSNDQMTQGILALNAMLKGFQIDGINLFRQQQISVTVLANQGYVGNEVNITPLILGIENARWVIQPAPNLYERPLAIYPYNDYMNLPNKMAQTQSGPSIMAFNKEPYSSSVYLWPIPTNGGTLNMTVARTTNDVNVPSDPTDFPDEWTEGLIYCLADRLMDDSAMAASDPATAQRIEAHADRFYEKLLNFDRPTSIFMRPFGRKGSGKFWR